MNDEIEVIVTDPVVEVLVEGVPGGAGGGGSSTVERLTTESFNPSVGAPYTVTLAHTPVPGSVTVFWHGLPQPGSSWTLSGHTITIPDPEGRYEAGDGFTVLYSWLTSTDSSGGDAITTTVPLTRGRLQFYDADGTHNDTFIDLPTSWPVTFDLTVYPDPTDDHISTTILYPVEWNGHDCTGTDFIPATPDGYELSEITPVIKAYRTGGAPDTITDDSSTWGYSPAPLLSPYLLTDAANPLTFDTIPDAEPTDPIVCGAGFTLDDEQFQSGLQFGKWWDFIGAPPYASESRAIVVTYWALRFTYTPIGG